MPPGPLRLRRLELGLRQEDVAQIAGLARETIVRLEAGTAEPSWRTATKLARALDCQPDRIFPFDDESPAANGALEEDGDAAPPTRSG
jgi:DNA-binding XRE family transcriptional regulator